jgi:hypothetical protein
MPAIAINPDEARELARRLGTRADDVAQLAHGLDRILDSLVIHAVLAGLVGPPSAPDQNELRRLVESATCIVDLGIDPDPTGLSAIVTRVSSVAVGDEAPAVSDRIDVPAGDRGTVRTLLALPLTQADAPLWATRSSSSLTWSRSPTSDARRSSRR